MSLGIGWKAIDNKRQEQARLAEIARREHLETMATMFKDAKALVKAGKWVEAKQKLEEMQAEDPEYEARSVANYLQNAENEIPVQQQLADARKFLANNELAKAHEVLQKVKTTNQELALREARQALETRATERLGEARTLLAFQADLAKMEALKALCEDLLVVRPDDREAAEIKKQAETAIYRIKNPTIAPPPPDTPWLEVQQRFKNGDASGALSLAQACANKHAQCRALEANIKEFETKSKRVEELGENELVALYELDKKIAGGSSSDLSKPVRTQLVSKLFLKASQAKSTGNWSRAIEYARKVLQADPAQAGAQAIVNEARNQAREIYLRGYQLKESNPDEAIRLFKEVISMTPPDDENHQKAKSRVSELQR
jgi:tetratricopeptide (TPR) repeat protein